MRIGIDYTAAVQQRAGIGRYTRELVGALLALEASGDHPRRYTLFAAAGGASARLKAALTGLSSTVRCRTLPLNDEWLARLWQRARLPIPVEAITGRLDLFYSPDFVLPPTLPGTRTLLTVHDLSFLRYPDHFVPPLVRYLSRVVPRSVARADRVLADSQATRADLIELLGTQEEKITVLYSGVERRFRPEREAGEAERLRARYGLGELPYILTVGTLQPRKNTVRLIHAFAQVRKYASGQVCKFASMQVCRYANMQTCKLAYLQTCILANLHTCPLADLSLVIAGGQGWLSEPIVAEAERLGERVRLLGFVDDADLPALYRGAALFVFPSLYEGFGLPVLEAMACGVPVVCSNASSLPEVAGDAALLVAPEDTDGLAQAMVRALSDDNLRQAMIARGLQQARRFNWDEAARQLLDMFRAMGTREA